MAELKVMGAEWKAFLDDTTVWTDFNYIDDEEILINGVQYSQSENIKDDDQVVVRGGMIMKNGGDWADSEDLLDVFRAWHKKRNTVYFVVEVSIEKEAGVKSAISGAGGKLRR